MRRARSFRVSYLDASIGQFKIPVSYEGYNSSSKLLFAERAPVSRKYGDVRDMGLRLANFNGTTLDNLDNNKQKMPRCGSRHIRFQDC